MQLHQVTSLVLAPHPDDETLGCGGFVIEACKRGRPPLIVAVTDGAGSHAGSTAYPPARLKALRAAELRSAAQILGVPRESSPLFGPAGHARAKARGRISTLRCKP